MPRRLAEARAASVSEYVRLFQRGGSYFSSSLRWYRGESRLRLRRALLPSIARGGYRVQDEWHIYQRFRQSAAAFLPHAQLDDWDWMLYMRHYGVKTRLLDWTESALVGLYFAVANQSRHNVDGVVWCLDPYRLNELAGQGKLLYCASMDTELQPYTTASLKRTPAGTIFRPVALIAQRSFPRLIAQQGVFTITHLEQIAIDSIGDPHLLGRITIPSRAKPGIYAALKSLGINRLAMFPELQSLGGM
jgi:hypothetical protein